LPKYNRDWRENIARWSKSPFHFVLEALFEITEDNWHPWEPGSPLPEVLPNGPELWQGEFLKDVGAAITDGQRRFAVRAGHGVGKTTVEAWVVLWFLLFMRPCKVPITANSQDQLRDVVWAEIAHWWRKLPPFLHNMLEVGAERIVVKADPTEAFAAARTARPEKPEALQGFHSDNLLFLIEEASGIDDIIFETAGGALSSEKSWVMMFANPTRTSGYFHRAFHGARTGWRRYHVPCGASSRVSPQYAKNMANEHGSDSNVYRVRVLGEFPQSEDDAVIPLGLIEASIGREVQPNGMAIVWGLDVARFGDDTTALVKRRGNMLLEPPKEWRKADLMQTTGLVTKEYRETPLNDRPSAINVDVIGMGGGVVDRLNELGLPVRGVNVGESPGIDRNRYMRLRDELWFEARKWFDSRAVCLPAETPEQKRAWDLLTDELVGPKYKVESSGKLKVESKDEMKKRGIKSPNQADAFCLTFAGGDLFPEHLMNRPATSTQGYDPFEVGTADYERHVRQINAGTEYSPF
jgi:phage terminase large subunit